MVRNNLVVLPNQFAALPARSSVECRESQLTRFAKWLFRPSVIWLPWLLLGAVLWYAPPEDAAGFSKREAITFGGTALLTVWYGIIFFSARFAEVLVGVRRRRSRVPCVNEKLFYMLLTLVALVGSASGIKTSLSGGESLSGMVDDQQGNKLKQAMYENYGWKHTLRYASAVSGGLAIYHIVFRRRFGLLSIVNLLLVLATAVMSARLILVEAVFVSLALAVRFGGIENFPLRRVVPIGIVLACALMFMTWFREGGTYSDMVGTRNPVVMQYLQIKRYLGAPIQVSLGVSRIALDGDGPSERELNPWLSLTPTFWYPEHEKADNSGGLGLQWYLGAVDIEPNLTTNSAFALLFGRLSWWSFPFMALSAFLFSWLAMGLWRLEGPLFLASLPILYSFAELWRWYQFNHGFIIFQWGIVTALFIIVSVLPDFDREGDRVLRDSD